MPSQDDLVRRMEAARILRGKSRRELGELFKLDGLGVQDPERLVRHEIEFEAKHMRAACAHLRVPERWFTAETVDEVLGISDEVSLARTVASEVVAAMQALREGQSRGPRGMDG